MSSESPRRLAGLDPGNLKNVMLEKVLERFDIVATIGDARERPKRNLARVEIPLRRSRAREGFGRISMDSEK